MVEAVVTIPTFIILFAGLVFIWKLYLGKINAMGAARESLWYYAQSSNCGIAGSPSQDYSTPSGQTTSGISQQGSDGNIGAVDSAPGASKALNGPAAAQVSALNQPVGTVGQTATMTLHASPILGGFSAQVSGKMSLICNEPPADTKITDLPNMAVSEFSNLANW
jgi:hypothetical protein